MILANFDLSFFTSIPGLLITGGVLLLLIALIIFIATGNKKGKKDKKEEKKEEAVSTTPSVADGSTVATMDATPTVTPDVAAPGVQAQPEVKPMEPVNNTVDTTPNAVNTVNSGNDGNTINPSTVNVTPVQDNNVVQPQPVVNPTPSIVSEEPKEKMQPEVVPTVTPTVNVVNQDVVSAPQEVIKPIETPVVNEAKAVEVPNNTVTPNTTVASSEPITIVDSTPKEEAKPIYGGVSSVIPKIDVAGEEHRPIYGGADPLENTGTIPTINTQTTPVVPKVEEQPKVDTVEPVTVSVPKVEIPTVEAVNVETTKQEVVTPSVPSVEPAPAPKKEEAIESLF